MDNIDYTRFIAGFVFVLALIGAIGWLVKRLQQNNKFMQKNTLKKRVQIGDRIPIDAKRQLMLIKWDDDEYLIMLGQNEVVLGSKKGVLSEKKDALDEKNPPKKQSPSLNPKIQITPKRTAPHA